MKSKDCPALFGLLFFTCTMSSLGDARQQDTTVPNRFAFTQAEYIVAEDAGSAIITVWFYPGNRGISGSVGFSTEDGTATAGEDYIHSKGSLSFSGPAPRSFNVPVIWDALDEEEQIVHLRLGGPEPQSTATLRITNVPRPLAPQPTRSAGPVQILTRDQLARVFDQLNEIDFETLPDGGALPNPLRLTGVTFADPASIESGFCSSPSCEPDPDNPTGGNMALIVHQGAKISFAQPRKIVVLDLQGNGANRISFRVTDAKGRKKTMTAQTADFAPTLVGVSSFVGIRKVEVLRVGPAIDARPMALARLLFSAPIRRKTVANAQPTVRPLAR